VAPLWATSRDVLDGRRRPEAILDLCPKVGTTITLDAPIEVVTAEETTTGEKALVPAELVFLPFRPGGRRRKLHFGSSSNGLASGNTLREATIHGLCEIVERDVRTFQAVRDTGAPVNLDSVHGDAADLVETIRAAGLELHVRTADNGLGIPYFMALIHDPETIAPQLLNSGYGCHPIRSIAFVRAVSEAAQSRLTIIHGGRDDLTDHQARFKGWTSARKRAYAARAVATVSSGRSVPFGELPDLAPEIATLEHCERALLRRLGAAGFDHVYRVAFCRPGDELQVVRVIVPRMEFLTEGLQRVGPRLRDHARAA
jgi:ribosomal protein S12 methylthiotransferase accessory factor